MAPTVLPLFIGAALAQDQDLEDLDFYDALDAAQGLLEPLLNLTMLDGINNTLEAVKYDYSGNPITAIMQTIIGSYLSQGIPTVLGAAARTWDDTRRSSFTAAGEGATERWWNRLIQSSIIGRLQIASRGRMAYVDAWGRVDTQTSIFIRAAENFVSPGYYNPVTTTALDDELTRLAEATGDNGVFPDRAGKSFSVGGETYAMTQEEYQAHLIDRGQNSFRLVQDIVNDPVYARLDDATRAQAVELAYQYAASMAKVRTNEAYSPDKWMTKLADLEASGADAAEYLILRAQAEASDVSLTEQAISSGYLTDREVAAILVMETTMPASFTDPYTTGYEYVMTESQQWKYAQVYDELFRERFLELAEDPDYREGSTAERKELVSQLKSEVGAQVKEEMSDWLWDQGVEPTEKK